MLHLLQIMNYMIQHLEYTKEEIETYFMAIESGGMSLETALDLLNIAEFNSSSMKLIKEKLPKWRSALAVVIMRLEDQ